MSTRNGRHVPTSPAPLTPRQREVLAFVAEYVRTHDYPPSLEEIRRTFGQATTSGAKVHVNALVCKGWLKRAAKTGPRHGRSRTLRVLHLPPPAVLGEVGEGRRVTWYGGQPT